MRCHLEVGTTVAALALAAVVPPLGVNAQELTYSGSVGVATGTYIFTDRTTTFTLLNALRWRWRPIELSVSLPVVTQNSTALTLIGGRPVPTGGPDHEAVRQRQPGQRIPTEPRGGAGVRAVPADAANQVDGSGSVAASDAYETNIGDPVGGLALTVFEGMGVLRALAVQGFAKAPVADLESGIGTEEWDFGAGASATLAAGATLLIADATWWSYGDLPDLPLEDGLSWALSVGRLLGPSWSMLASVNGASRIVPTADAPVSLSVGASRRVGDRGSFSLGASVGLAESSPDFSAFLGWSARLTQSSR